ncbi:MAG: SDR family oxidoreductase [Candidatus Omnitrophota bacterium]|nr:SDR family oxidoreductase [Candidatus Omnitrophota bacterium]
MRFLVTGGAGFIGSHIVERLLKEGHYVRVLDNFSSGKRDNLSFVIAMSPEGATKQSQNNFELIEGDIRDYNACSQATKDIDYVLHQAALRSVPRSMTMPHEYNAVNIDGFVNILEAALKNKVKRVVYASSSSVYGDATSFPQKETDPCNPISPYALTKLVDEHYASIFSINFGLETVGLRYFNVFGPRQSADDEYAIVIPKFANCILDDKNPPIHGTGKQSRDFTYVDNVVEANILAATRHCDEPRRGDEAISKTFCEVFNVACGSDNTILNLVDTLNVIMNKSIKPVLGPIRQGDVFRTCADNSKIKSVLGFVPKINFKEGLERTARSFKILRDERKEAGGKKKAVNMAGCNKLHHNYSECN